MSYHLLVPRAVLDIIVCVLWVHLFIYLFDKGAHVSMWKSVQLVEVCFLLTACHVDQGD